MGVARRALPWALAAAFAACLLGAARTGADFGEYELWARVALTGDIFQIEHDIGSPLGVPLSQWSHGTGFVAAVGRALFEGALGTEAAQLAIAWLAAVVMGWAAIDVLRSAAGGDLPLAFFGAGVAYVGTHLGYYAHVYSSESLSYAALAVAARWCLTPRAWKPLDALVVGSACGLLVILRSQLLPYAALALAVLAWRLWKAPERTSPRWAAARFAVALAPFALALAQAAFVNRWMTGSWLKSPYVFGDGDFRSLDPTRPELLTVLVHPFHGLLAYHPLYAVGFAALVAHGLARRREPEGLLALATAAVALAAYYLQASWYCWWLGTGTYGMRGLGILGLPLTLGLVRRLREIGPRPQAYAWIAASMAACVWSFGLLLQGESMFVAWPDLLDAQARIASRPDVILPVAVSAAAAWIATAGARGVRRALAAGAAATFGWAVFDLVLPSPPPGLPDAELEIEPAAILTLGVAAAVPLLARTLLAPPGPPASPRARRAAEVAIGAAVVLVLAGATALFARAAVRTESVIAGKTPPGRPFTIRASSQLPEIEATFLEYLQIPGYEEPKKRLLDYLARAKQESREARERSR